MKKLREFKGTHLASTSFKVQPEAPRKRPNYDSTKRKMFANPTQRVKYHNWIEFVYVVFGFWKGSRRPLSVNPFLQSNLTDYEALRERGLSFKSQRCTYQGGVLLSKCKLFQALQAFGERDNAIFGDVLGSWKACSRCVWPNLSGVYWLNKVTNHARKWFTDAIKISTFPCLLPREPHPCSWLRLLRWWMGHRRAIEPGIF